MTADWRADRIGSALRGENPAVPRRLAASFATLGDVQFLPGYRVLLAAAPSAERLRFLADLELLGEAVERVCARRDPAFRRVNMEILGNTDPVLHAHVWPRYSWEPPSVVGRPAWPHPPERWTDPATALGPCHDGLRAELTAEIDRLRGLEP